MIVILSGPSGVGKDTVLEAWRRVNLRVARVVSFTTRKPRPGEKDGIDYRFIDQNLFMDMVAAGAFLEYKEVHGNYYGTPLDDLKRKTDEGKIAVLKIDVQGALAAMDALPEAITVFLIPPDGEELARRIRERGADSSEDVVKRLKNAEFEMSLASRYQHLIENRCINEVVKKLENLVT